jgi:AcrR family transcriptional regulator
VGLREQKRIETWRSIRRAGLDLMRARGFDAVSVEEIAAAARVSRTTFFNYFDSKESLVFDHDPEEPAEWRALFASRPAHEAVWDSLREIFAAYFSAKGEHIATQKELKKGAPKLAASFAERESELWSDLHAWVAARIDDDPSGMTLSLTMSAATSVLTTAYALWDVRRGTEHLVDLLREGFARVRVDASPTRPG